MAANLTALTDIINKNVTIIQRSAEKQGLAYPSLDDIYDASRPNEALTIDPEVLSAALLAASAASQLVATLKLPGLALLDRANAFHIPSALRLASESCVVEILREAGPSGLDVADIAAKTNVNSTILARALRLLATHYVFKEVKPNVFANNRLSALMDTGKNTATLQSLVEKRNEKVLGHGISNVQGEKYVGSNGIPALVEQCTDEVFKSSSYIPDVVLSNDFSKTPFQRALNFDGTMWEFFEKYPGYLQRIQMAMVGFISTQPQQKLFKGFDWSQLPASAVVVDVGGGNGSESFEIAKKAPHLKIIVQDREETIKQVTTPTWEANPEQKALLDSGRVSLHAQDFFEKQPPAVVGNASLFFLRFITHDWPTAECIKILKQLHDAASSKTKLMLVDQLVPYACPTPPSLAFEGSKLLDAPAPLLANLGEANSDVYTTDFTMAALLNAQERTLGEFKDITEAAGWKIEKVYQTVGSSLSQILCIKA
ncbi:S-adenosyl-L-methionine-dependent methyltransferase [Punctularia strigosozonata HHB-11173 SS5]|uniref:S-adenosyl-L-methionine-dependent methyltransferase n=1 Tax=Punctularia strigosozonata (strain HHB-11173) TaxID=741275 RepID=UPI0004416D9F|nr:S-adenosyl-L-methionine-dependent methyltransferase [Punctularia strigosozonata HHB-11173 SS5]EIN13035.1 S-adenosyl-L-methionine-dependent methyltransferase [Punctularia strigosozonata HHB-11173 SS5]